MSALSFRELVTHGLGPLELDIPAGQCVCLSGASGSGKSLTLRALADLDPHQGEVTLNGDKAADISGPVWRRQVGLLPAESRWWCDTVGEHFEEIDTALLAKVGFNRDVMQWQINRLSTGERQRLALLRLMTNQPRVLLLDEPTASLDRENILRVENLITEYRQQHNTAVLWVSHDDEQIARVCNRHVKIRDGKLVEGAP